MPGLLVLHENEAPNVVTLSVIVMIHDDDDAVKGNWTLALLEFPRAAPALPHAEAEGPPFTKLAASFYM